MNKHLQDSSVEATALGEDDKKELLRRLAYRMQTGAQGLAGNHLWHDELAAEIEAYLQARFLYTPERAAMIADVMIGQFRERNFVLARYGSKIYGFVHRALLEFFCAGEIVARFEKTRVLSEEELVTEIFGAHWEDLAWTEVLRLIAGMVDVSVADRLITYLVTQARPTNSSVLDRPPLDAVALAVQCLVEVRNTGAAALSAQQTMRALIEALHRPIRSFADNRYQRLEKVILPAVAAIGAGWPDRELYLDWFHTYGCRTGIRPTSWFAARFTAALFPDSESVRAELTRYARTNPIADQRRACVLGLAKVWSDLPEIRDLVLLAAKDPATGVRQVAVEALSEHWTDSPQVLTALHTAAQDYDEEIRSSALVALSIHWTTEPSAHAAVKHALRDHHENVRTAALNALVTRWPDHEDTLPAVRHAVHNDPHWSARKSALEALVNGWSDHPETVPLVLSASREVDEDVRQAALEALAGRWADHPETLPTVHRAVGDSDEDIREAAISLLASRWTDHADTPGILERANHDFDGAVRFKAIRALTWHSGTPDTVPDFLWQAIRDFDPDVRERAVDALATEWSDHSAARIAVVRAVRDPDPSVRCKALSALAEHWANHPDTRLTILAATRDPSVEPRKTAFQLVAGFWGDQTDSLTVLQDAVRDEEWSIRQVALEALSSLQPGSEETRLSLIRATRDPAGANRRTAIIALAADPLWTAGHAEILESMFRDTQAGARDLIYESAVIDRFTETTSQDDLIEAARSPIAEVRQTALLELVARGSTETDARESVQLATRDESVSVRRTAFDLMVTRWADTAAGRQAVFEATRDPNWDIRYAATAVATSQWPHEVEDIGLPERALLDDGNLTRKLAVTSLILGSPGTESTLRALMRVGNDFDWTLRFIAQQWLATHLGSSDEAVSALRQMSRETRPDARSAAIMILATLWPERPESLSLVHEALKDQSDTVRIQAMDVLAAVWPEHPSTSSHIEHTMWDPALKVAEFAWKILAVRGRDIRPATATEAIALMRDCNRANRAAALKSLLIRWPESPESRIAVRLGLFDESEGIQCIARDAICLRWTSDDALSAAEDALGHPSPNVRSKGLQIIARAGRHDPGAHDLLRRAIYDDSDSTRFASLEILTTALSDHPGTRELMHKLTRDQSDSVRTLIIKRLIENWPTDADTRTEIVNAARDPFPELRKLALESLAIHWPDEPGARAAYRMAAIDPDGSVRESARDSALLPSRPIRELHEVLGAARAAEWTERLDAITELLNRWSDHPDTYEFVFQATGDPVGAVRSGSIRALAKYWPTREGVFEAIVSTARDPDESVRWDAVHVLAASHPEGDGSLDLITKMCDDANASVRSKALAELARVRPDFLDANPDVIFAALHDVNWFPRNYALEIAILRLPESVTQSRDCLCDSAPSVRGKAGLLLARYAAGLHADLDALLTLHTSDDAHSAAAAGYILATRWSDREEILPTLCQAAASGDHVVRIWALEALAANWKEHPSTVLLLHRALEDECPGIRETALGALAPMEYQSLDLPVLDAASRDSDEVVRFTARSILAARSLDSGFGEDFLDAALHGDDPYLDRFWAVEALTPWRLDAPTPLETVDRALSSEDLPFFHREWFAWIHRTISD